MTAWNAASVLSLMQQGRLHEARAQLNARVHAVPADGEAWFLLGSVAQQLNDDGASGFFTRAAELLPQDVRPLSALGAMLGDAGDSVGALAHFERALTLEPGNPRLLTNAAIALESLGRDDEALDHYDRALSAFAGFGDARRNRCLLLLRRGDAPAAREDARQLVASFPDLALGHQLQGDCEAADGNLVEARAAYQRATSLDPHALDAWQRLVAVAQELGDHHTAALAAAQIAAMADTR